MTWQKLSLATRNDPFILPIYLPSIIFAVCQGLIVPILPLYLVDFGVSYWLVGLVLGGEGLGMLLGDVPSGIIVSRLGKKRAMWLGITCSALATAALFWTSTIWVALPVTNQSDLYALLIQSKTDKDTEFNKNKKD